jgi:hypothetical protein
VASTGGAGGGSVWGEGEAVVQIEDPFDKTPPKSVASPQRGFRGVAGRAGASRTAASLWAPGLRFTRAMTSAMRTTIFVIDMSGSLSVRSPRHMILYALVYAYTLGSYSNNQFAFYFHEDYCYGGYNEYGFILKYHDHARLLHVYQLQPGQPAMVSNEL